MTWSRHQVAIDDNALSAIMITSYPGKTLREHAAAAAVPIVEKPLFNHTLTDSIRATLEQQVRADAVANRNCP